MTKNDTIQNLNNIFEDFIKKEIGDRTCVLLDLPNYYNPGDQLIWEGEESILKRMAIQINYRASLHFFNPKKVSINDCILLQGGGNFGDLYSKHQKFRQYIVNKFPNNKIIILPQTIHFSNEKVIKTSSQAFSYHPNLVICARDTNSFNILKSNFVKNKAYLLPDAAFGLNSSYYAKIKPGKEKVLLLYRSDSELGSRIPLGSLDYIKKLEIFDWPKFNSRSKELLLHQFTLKLNILILSLYKLFGIHWNEKYDIFGYIQYHSKFRQIESARNFLSQYDLVISTRLHGHILSSLMGIPNIILDNSYGKNKSFYEAWMQNNTVPAFYADSTEDIKNILGKYFPNLIKHE